MDSMRDTRRARIVGNSGRDLWRDGPGLRRHSGGWVWTLGLRKGASPYGLVGVAQQVGIWVMSAGFYWSG